MKIAIFADLHDNQPNLEKFLIWCKNNDIEALIACGDITNSDTLEYLANNFSGPVYLIRGNMDLYPEKFTEALSNINYLGRYGQTVLSGRAVGICHEPDFINDLPKNKNILIIFYGHTHKPWIEKRGKVELVNPGTLGGVFTPATFTYWDTASGELRLVRLDQI